MADDGNIIGIGTPEATQLHTAFTATIVFHALGSGECYIQTDCIHTISSAFTNLNSGHGVLPMD